MGAPMVPRKHIVRILRSGLEKLLLVLLSRNGLIDVKKPQDIIVQMGVMAVVALVVVNVFDRFITEENEELITSIAGGLLFVLYYRLSKRLTNGTICLPTF